MICWVDCSFNLCGKFLKLHSIECANWQQRGAKLGPFSKGLPSPCMGVPCHDLRLVLVYPSLHGYFVSSPAILLFAVYYF